MKKLLIFICAVMLVFGMVGSASAIRFTETVSLEGRGYVDSDSGRYEWTWRHDTPEDVWEPSVYIVESADVEIKAIYDDGEGEDEWNIKGHFDDNWIWSNTTEGIYDVSVTWDVGDVGNKFLGVELSSSEIDNITLYSTFTLDYNREEDIEDIGHAPEPSTILLMGSGLLGLVGYGRKRFSKKS